MRTPDAPRRPRSGSGAWELSWVALIAIAGIVLWLAFPRIVVAPEPETSTPSLLTQVTPTRLPSTSTPPSRATETDRPAATPSRTPTPTQRRASATPILPSATPSPSSAPPTRTPPAATAQPTATLTASPANTSPPPTDEPPPPPPPPAIPNAPSGLTVNAEVAGAGAVAVVLRWNDNSDNEVGFNVLGSVNGEPLQPLISPNAPANMTSLPIAQLFRCEAVEVTYSIVAEVSAFNEAGASAAASGSVTFTLLACPTATATPSQTVTPTEAPPDTTATPTPTPTEMAAPTEAPTLSPTPPGDATPGTATATPGTGRGLRMMGAL